MKANLESATATTGDDLIARIQQAAIDRAERGKPEGRNQVSQFFYEASLQPAPVSLCAWCGSLISDGDASLPVSHGCCQPCKDKLMQGMKR